MKTVKTLTATVIVSLLAIASSAHAGGFLADTFIKPFSPELARAADRINHNMGNPVDHAIAAGMNVVVPGTGTALEAGWQIQRSGVLNGVPQFQHPMAAPGMPMMMQPPQPPFVGNFCHTPAGRFGPGPANNVGAPCFVNLQFGPVPGTVGL